MKKGIIRIVLGCILIVLQALSIMGNVKVGINYTLDFTNIYTLIYSSLYLLGSCLVGIVGIILLLSGVIAQRKNNTESPHSASRAFDPHETSTGTTEDSHKIPSFKIALILILSFLLILSLTANFYLYKNSLELTQEIYSLNQSLESLQFTFSDTTTNEEKYFDNWTESLQEISFYQQRIIICDPGEMLYHTVYCSDSLSFILKYGSTDCFYLDINVADQFGYSPCESCRPEYLLNK